MAIRVVMVRVNCILVSRKWLVPDGGEGDWY